MALASCRLPDRDTEDGNADDAVMTFMRPHLDGHRKLVRTPVTEFVPQPSNEITAYKKRSAGDPQQPINQRGALLEFPPFHHDVLTQPSWDARHHNGRIKVLLSEQLIGKNGDMEGTDLGIANDLVCFAFQHAPLGE